MTYDLRPATIDGEACSTCERSLMTLDWYGEPCYRCLSQDAHTYFIDLPDETVCDAWRAKQ